MDISVYKNLIRNIEENMIDMQEMGNKCTYLNEKIYWDNLIWQQLYRKCLLETALRNISRAEKLVGANKREEKVFTLEELGKYNGKNDMPAYVVVNGIVYDVSLQPAWGGASHFGLTAGRDLTNEFNSCHNLQRILDKLPKVGILQK